MFGLNDDALKLLTEYNSGIETFLYDLPVETKQQHVQYLCRVFQSVPNASMDELMRILIMFKLRCLDSILKRIRATLKGEGRGMVYLPSMCVYKLFCLQNEEGAKIGKQTVQLYLVLNEGTGTDAFDAKLKISVPVSEMMHIVIDPDVKAEGRKLTVEEIEPIITIAERNFGTYLTVSSYFSKRPDKVYECNVCTLCDEINSSDGFREYFRNSGSEECVEFWVETLEHFRNKDCSELFEMQLFGIRTQDVINTLLLGSTITCTNRFALNQCVETSVSHDMYLMQFDDLAQS